MIKGVEGEITEISGNEVTLKAGQFYLNILCSTNTIKELSLSAKVHLLTYLSFSADRALKYTASKTVRNITSF